jgi:hypothetical protein
MAIKDTLEKAYMLKSVGISEYYLGGNVEILGETWKNQGLGLLLRLVLSAKIYIKNVVLKFEGLFGKDFKPIKSIFTLDDFLKKMIHIYAQ